MTAVQGNERFTAKRGHETPPDTERLTEEVCERKNFQQALNVSKPTEVVRPLTG